MTIDAADLVVARCFPVVIKGLHDMADDTGFRLVREAVRKEVNAKVAKNHSSGQRE